MSEGQTGTASLTASLAETGLGLFGTLLTAHHKKAVATEQNVLGSAVPAAEESFKKIMDRFSAGMITAGEVPGKLDAVIEQFKSDTASIRQQSGEAGHVGPSDFIQPYHPKNGKCNAACWWVFKLQAEAKTLKAQVAAGAGGNIAATGGKSTRSVGKNSGTGVPEQEFSVLSNLTGNHLTLAVVGVFLFVAAVSIAMAVKHRRKA